MTVWNNRDGLRVMFPGDRVPLKGGSYNWGGDLVTIEGEIAGTAIGTSATLFDTQIIVPRNFRIEAVEVVSEVALDGVTSLDIGLQEYDGTEHDYDGLVDAIPLASLNVNGEKTVFTAGVSLAGVLVGATLTKPGYLTVLRTGSAATVGRLIVRVKGYVPAKDANPGNFT